MATSLDDLIEAVQTAVIKAQQLAEDHHVDLVGRFFEQDAATGQMRARTQEIWLPSMHPDHDEGAFVKVAVPLMTLANLGAIRIKELKVEFDAKLGSLDTADVDKDGTPDVLEAAGAVGAAPPSPPDPAGAPSSTPPLRGGGQRRGPGLGGGRPGGGPRFGGMRGGGPEKRLSFDMKHGNVPGDDGTTVHISITFEGTEPPEGVVRLNGAIIKQLP